LTTADCSCFGKHQTLRLVSDSKGLAAVRASISLSISDVHDKMCRCLPQSSTKAPSISVLIRIHQCADLYVLHTPTMPDCCRNTQQKAFATSQIEYCCGPGHNATLSPASDGLLHARCKMLSDSHQELVSNLNQPLRPMRPGCEGPVSFK